MANSPQSLSPHDLALGRLAIAWGWLDQAAAAEVHRRSGGGPLGPQLVAAGFLRPEQIQQLEAALSGRQPAASLQDSDAATTVYSPPPAPLNTDPDAATVYQPPPGAAAHTTAWAPPPTGSGFGAVPQGPASSGFGAVPAHTTAWAPPPGGAFDPHGNTVLQGPPGSGSGAFDPHGNTVLRAPPGSGSGAFDPHGNTVLQGPPGSGSGAFDPHGNTVLQGGPPPPSDVHRRGASDSQRMFDSSVSALPQVGERIEGGYTIQALLGQGGMGAVYRGVDEAGKPVALKFILPNRDPSGAMGLRFEREAQAMARIGKVPGIVPVHRAGTHGGCAYMVMGLIDGRDLMQQVKADGALTVEDALDLMAKVADSIHGCHEHQVLHRDLKPANVLVRAEDGEPFVTDFGLALIDGDSAPVDRLTKTGELMGTPAFMPPEQADGNKDLIGPCSDIYSLGALLFYLVCGRPPFEGKNLQILHALFKKDPPTLAAARGRPVPPDLQLIVSKAMAKEPASRYATAGELAADLRRLRNGEPVTARAPSRWERFRWRLRQRDPGAVAQLVVPLAALIVVAILLNLGEKSDEVRFAEHVEALSSTLDRYAFEQDSESTKSGNEQAIYLGQLESLARQTVGLGEAISPAPDPSAPLPERLSGLLARLQRGPPRPDQAELDRLVPVLALSLELLTDRYDQRPLARSWSVEAKDPRANVLAALGQLGFGLDPGNRLEEADIAGLNAKRKEALEALEAHARTTPGDAWSPLARELARQVCRFEEGLQARVKREYESGVPEDTSAEREGVPPHWLAYAQARQRTVRAQLIDEVLGEALSGDFEDLMRQSNRLAVLFTVLQKDAIGKPELLSAAKKLDAFMRENGAGFQVVDPDLVGTFAHDFARTWGGLVTPPFTVIKEYRSWLLRQHMSGRPPSVDDLLVSIRLGSEFGSMLAGAADSYVKLIGDYPRHERGGDFFFLWAELLDLLDEQGDHDVARQAVLERYAEALGEELSDEERTRLGIQGEREPLASPLSPIWVDRVKLRLYHNAIRLALGRYTQALRQSKDDPAFDLEEAHANFADAVWALERFARQALESDLERLNPATLLRVFGQVIAGMRSVTESLPPVHGLRELYHARFFQLSGRAREIATKLVERLATNAVNGGVSETEDLWTSAASPAQTVRRITGFTREEGKFLNQYDSADEALRRMREQLHGLRDVFPSNYPYELAHLVWDQALYCEEQQAAKAIAEHALGAPLPGLEDEYEKALQVRDRFRAWFAVQALQRDELEAAKAWLEASIEAGRFNEAFWSDDLLRRLGTTRAEVNAQLGGD